MYPVDLHREAGGTHVATVQSNTQGGLARAAAVGSRWHPLAPGAPWARGSHPPAASGAWTASHLSPLLTVKAWNARCLLKTSARWCPALQVQRDHTRRPPPHLLFPSCSLIATCSVGSRLIFSVPSPSTKWLTRWVIVSRDILTPNASTLWLLSEDGEAARVFLEMCLSPLTFLVPSFLEIWVPAWAPINSPMPLSSGVENHSRAWDVNGSGHTEGPKGFPWWGKQAECLLREWITESADAPPFENWTWQFLKSTWILPVSC